MKIFVYEHITGGGHGDQPLPSGAAQAGDNTVKALVDDLLRLPDVLLTVWRDARLPDLPYAGFEDLRVTQRRVERFDRDQWAAQLESVDAVWIIAPETAGVLESLSTTAIRLGKTLLGCSPKAINICGSKIATVAALSAVGIDVAQAVPVEDSPNWSAPCVLKPDDGAGCDDTWLFSDSKSALDFHRLRPIRRPMLLQRFVSGEACSVSMLCHDGQAEILSINRQSVTVNDSKFDYQGVGVNTFVARDRRTGLMIKAMTEMVAAVIPGLWGFVGIDFVIGPTGPVVIEINPRLTHGYVGLSESLGVNVAEQVLDMIAARPNSSALSPIQPWASSPASQSALN